MNGQGGFVPRPEHGSDASNRATRRSSAQNEPKAAAASAASAAASAATEQGQPVQSPPAVPSLPPPLPAIAYRGESLELCSAHQPRTGDGTFRMNTDGTSSTGGSPDVLQGQQQPTAAEAVQSAVPGLWGFGIGFPEVYRDPEGHEEPRAGFVLHYVEHVSLALGLRRSSSKPSSSSSSSSSL